MQTPIKLYVSFWAAPFALNYPKDSKICYFFPLLIAASLFSSFLLKTSSRSLFFLYIGSNSALTTLSFVSCHKVKHSLCWQSLFLGYSTHRELTLVFIISYQANQQVSLIAAVWCTPFGFSEFKSYQCFVWV